MQLQGTTVGEGRAGKIGMTKGLNKFAKVKLISAF